MIYDTDGSIKVTVVDGTSLVGVQAPDGSINVSVDDEERGVQHSSGAIRVNSEISNKVYDPTGAYHINNLLGVRNSPSTLPEDEEED